MPLAWWVPKVRPCARCGRDFTADAPARKYCSPVCRLVTADCRVCGATFTSPDPSQRYCSYACSNSAMRKTQPCEVCGEQYSPKIGGANMRNGTVSRWCSRACQSVGMKARAKVRINIVMTVVTPCWVCSSPTENTTSLRRRCCSDACRAELTRLNYNSRYAARRPLRSFTCKACGKEFKTEYRDRRHKYCSAKCMVKAQNEADRMRMLLVGGTGLRVSDLPAEYVEAMKAYRKLNQEVWRNSQWKN